MAWGVVGVLRILVISSSGISGKLFFCFGFCFFRGKGVLVILVD